jgi:benzoate/toluate 1,2-dioxygenase subunit beta
MSSTLEKPNAATRQLSTEDVRQFLYREARFLDDKEWESWLAVYAPNVEF